MTRLHVLSKEKKGQTRNKDVEIDITIICYIGCFV